MTILIGLLISALAVADAAPLVASSVSSNLAISVRMDTLTADDGVTVLVADGTATPLGAK